MRIGIVTISDRASSGVYEDKSGPAIIDWLRGVLVSPWQPVPVLIADEQLIIAHTLQTLVDDDCALVLTTGGTGPSLRDVTPEATMTVCDRVLDGFGEQMRRVSLEDTPTAILSRQIAGLRGKSLIINLPGKPTSIAKCLSAIFMAVPVCLHLSDAGEMRIRTDFFHGPCKVDFPQWIRDDDEAPDK